MEILKPVGLKVPLSDCSMNSIDWYANELTTYHNGIYVIGKDEEYLNSEPHYHIHFFTSKKCTSDSIKTFRCKTFKDKCSSRVKMYLGKDYKYDDATFGPMDWYAYAVKENFILSSGLTDEQLSEIKKRSHSALVIKKLSFSKSIELEKQTTAKKDFKDKILDYIKDNISGDIYVDFSIDRGKQIDNAYICANQFLINEQKFSYMRNCTLEPIVKEYLVKDKKWTAELIYVYFQKRFSR